MQSMKLDRTLILALLVTSVASTALAVESVSSPRGKETAKASQVAKGYPDRQAITFTSKAAEVPRLKGTNVDDRNLVRETRTQVYTGKGASQRPTFEIAPAK
jgi:hypothetical protein